MCKQKLPIHWQREVAQWLRVLDALTEVENTIPRATSGVSQTPINPTTGHSVPSSGH